MKKSRFTEEQIVSNVRETDRDTVPVVGTRNHGCAREPTHNEALRPIEGPAHSVRGGEDSPVGRNWLHDSRRRLPEDNTALKLPTNRESGCSI
jgi:hypothetical protein